MDFFTAVERRRSVRKFKPDPVPRDVLERIVAAGIEAPSGCNMQLRQYVIVDEASLMDRIRPMSPAMTAAPAAIVLLIDPQGTPYGEFWVQDASAAMENMLLAIVALGYAGCWVEGQIRRGWEEKLRKLLGVPQDLRVWSVTPVGKAAVDPKRPTKSIPADVTRYNGYG